YYHTIFCLMCLYDFLYFFFSSRRRHTRFKCDWSSDVCSSDLTSLAESIGLEAKMKDVDLVITGEGSLDRQTLEGKTPAGVARLARKLGKRVFAMVGRATEDRQARELFDGVYQNARAGMSQEENMKKAADLLRENARELANSL